jgi:hypothetical protein
MSMTDRWKGLGGWLQEAAPSIVDAVTAIAEAASGVTIDASGKRVFVPHTLMVTGLRHAIDQTEGIELVDVSAGADGYRIRANVKGKEVGALLVPERICWSNGVILVNATTPEGVTACDRSFATACLAAYASLFGGTPMVKLIADQLAPKGWSWDGKTASWTSDIAGHLDLPAFVRSATGAELSVTLNPEGAWLALTKTSASVDLNEIALFMGKQAIGRALHR